MIVMTLKGFHRFQLKTLNARLILCKNFNNLLNDLERMAVNLKPWYSAMCSEFCVIFIEDFRRTFEKGEYEANQGDPITLFC